MAQAIKRGVIAGAVIAVAGIALLVSNGAGAGTTVSGPRDCDASSILYCGALSTQELNRKYQENAYGDVHKVYQSFGISAADVASLNTRTVVGAVHANGTVWAEGQLIGVNARTAGRSWTRNSQPIVDTFAYSRPPSDSFASANTSIQIFIGYHGDNPSWAIISSCGNPLKWDAPEANIEKTVAKKGSNNYQDTIDLNHGDTATFKMTVSETTGRADLHNAFVFDEIQPGFTFVPGSVTVDGNSRPELTPDHIPLGKVKRGKSRVVTFQVKAELIGKECGKNLVKNVAAVMSLMQPTDYNGAQAYVHKACEPIFSCDVLKATIPNNVKPGDRIPFSVHAGEIKHTEITGYMFKVNGKTEQDLGRNTFSYTVPAAGDYKVTAHVKTTAGTTKETASCTKTFTAEDPVVTVCTALSGPASLTEGDKATYTATASAQGTTVNEYVFKVDDQEVQRSGSNTYEYTAVVGQHKVSVDVVFANGDVKTSNDCMKTVNVKEKVITACDVLNGPVVLTEGEKGTYIAEATAQGTTVSEYVFKVDGQEVQRSSSNTYEYMAVVGEHKISVEVVFANGDVKTSDDCMKTVDVKEKIVTACNVLNGPVVLTEGDEGIYTAEATAQGTTVSEYVFSVDGQEVQRSASNEFVYTAVTGMHTVAVSVVFANGDVKTSDDCAKQVKVKEQVITACNALSGPVALMVGDSGEYTVDATAQGTEVSEYVFMVNDVEVQRSANNSFTFSPSEKGTYTLKATVVFANGDEKSSDDCVKTVTVDEEVIVACDALTGPGELKVGGVGTYVASASATGTTIESYAFSVNGEVVQTGAADSYDFTPTAVGTYIVGVEVTFADGQVVSSPDCLKAVSVTEDPEPVYACDLLTITPDVVKVGEQVTFNLTVSAANGAVFKHAEFDFGDGTTDTITINSETGGSLTTFHTYETGGKKNVEVVAVFMVDGEEVRATNGSCRGAVDVTVDKCPYPGKETLNVEDQNCFEPCPYPGKQQYKKSDTDNCKPPVLGERTPELPKTGAAGAVGFFTAMTTAGALMHRRATLRK